MDQATLLRVAVERALELPGGEMTHPFGPDTDVDAQLVRDLVTESCLLVVEKLPRARRPVDPETFGQG